VALHRRYASPAEAERIRRALEPDAPPNLRSRVDGAELHLELAAPSARSARATLEDLLPCLDAAEKAGAGRSD